MDNLVSYDRKDAFELALNIFRESPGGVNVKHIDEVFNLAERIYNFFILPENITAK